MDDETITITNSSTPTKFETITILVVDDDTVCLSIVAALLKKFQYKVVTVKHPKDALCTLRIKGGDFDLVVSDVYMPDMNGFELQHVISEEFGLPVVLMSSEEKGGDVLKGLDKGAAFFISKPVSPNDLKDLWQYASMKKKSQVVMEDTQNSFIEENASFEKICSDDIVVSASSINDDKYNKKDLTTKFPIKDRTDEKKRNNSQSASQKKTKTIWTNSLHNRFLEAIRSIGLDRAVPKKILKVMNVPGLTRQNVASHLQKYRIFLRRVSDASYKIQYSDDNSLTSINSRSCSTSSSSRTNSSILMLNTLNKLRNLDSEQLSTINMVSFPNQKSLSNRMLTQPGFAQSRFLPNKESLLIPNTESTNSSVHHMQNNFLATSSVQPYNGLSTSFDAPMLGSTDITVSSNCEVSSHNNNAISSNLIMSTMPNEITTNLDQLARELGSSSTEPAHFKSNNNTLEKKLSDIMKDYQALLSSNLPLLENVENGGEIHDSNFYSPIFDLSELCETSTQQPIVEGKTSRCAIADEVNIHNKAKQNECENVISSSFYGSGTSKWDNHVPLFDQQKDRKEMTDFEEFNTSPQLNNTILPEEYAREDDDFFESLLSFGVFGEENS